MLAASWGTANLPGFPRVGETALPRYAERPYERYASARSVSPSMATVRVPVMGDLGNMDDPHQFREIRLRGKQPPVHWVNRGRTPC